MTDEELAFRASYILVRQWQTLEARAEDLVRRLNLPPEVATQFIADGRDLLGGEETYRAGQDYLNGLPPGLYEVHRYGGFACPRDPSRPAITSIRFCDKEGMQAWRKMIVAWYGPLGLNVHVDEESNVVSL